MIEYNGSKCEPHGQTRCVTCMALAAKGRKPASNSALVAPPEIAGGAPPDIEGIGNVRDRTSETVTVDVPEWEQPSVYDQVADQVAEQEAFTKKYDATVAQICEPPCNQPAPNELFTRDTFAALPTDDSHASKVLRAAAEYASTAQAWAQTLAYVEKIKTNLLTAELELGSTTKSKNEAEQALKELVG